LSDLSDREIKILGILWIGFAILGWVIALSEYAFGIEECPTFFFIGMYLVVLSFPISFFITKIFSLIERKISLSINDKEINLFWRIVGAIFIIATVVTIYGGYIYVSTGKIYWVKDIFGIPRPHKEPHDSTFFIIGIALYPLSVIMAEIVVVMLMFLNNKPFWRC